MSSLSTQSSDQNRGQNALQRRALQLKRWHELMQAEEQLAVPSAPSPPKVKFSSATLFLSAVAQNDVEECERLLRTSSDLNVNATTGDGLTALHQMAIDDNLEMCRWLLRHDADVNCRDNEGWTPLHAAASCGHFEIVKLLLSREECDVFAINCDGELARDVCDGDDCLQLIDDRMRRHLDVTIDDESDDGIPEQILTEIRNKELKQIESDFKQFLTTNRVLTEKAAKDWVESTRDPTSGATVVHVCAAKGYNEILTSILETIGDRLSLDSLLDVDGFTALHSAAFWRQMTTFETLLNFGANFELKTRDSRVVADLCHENPKIMELISETKKSRELQVNERTTLTTAETQRKLNAKRQRETRRPTQGVSKEDIEMALKTTTTTTTTPSVPSEESSEEPSIPPPMPSSPPPVVSLSPPSVNCVSTTVSVPLYPQRRRQKRRSTGIGDDVAPTGGDSENVDCVDSQKPILSTTSSTPQTTPLTTPQTRSRSSSRSSMLSADDEQQTCARDSSVGQELDYKKLYTELLKENAFLIRKIKESTDARKTQDKEALDWPREKRQLLRRISELEEELKTKDELLKDNVRLKDENSALIRVISKLSK